MKQQYYTPQEVADFVGLHVKTVRWHIAQGNLLATRIGSRIIRVKQSDLLAWLDERITPSAVKQPKQHPPHPQPNKRVEPEKVPFLPPRPPQPAPLPVRHAVIVTTSGEIIKWLQNQGIHGEVTDWATEELVAGKVVYSQTFLPYFIAAAADEFNLITAPRRPYGRRVEELTCEELEKCGKFQTYNVTRKENDDD